MLSADHFAFARCADSSASFRCSVASSNGRQHHGPEGLENAETPGGPQASDGYDNGISKVTGKLVCCYWTLYVHVNSGEYCYIDMGS